jgi:tRNA(adenine34) deaminase
VLLPPADSTPSAARTAVLAADPRSDRAAGPHAPHSHPGSAGERAQFDWDCMGLALEEARAARDQDEVPIGAVIALEGQIVGRGHNRTRQAADPTEHAELAALRQAARALGAQRLVGATVYTTVEPCFMCAGALAHARVARVVWGVRDPKFGGCASLGQVLSDPRANHRAELEEGLRADEARALLQTFFQSKRG